MADGLIMLESVASKLSLSCKQMWRWLHDINKRRSVSTNKAGNLIIVDRMAPAII